MNNFVAVRECPLARNNNERAARGSNPATSTRVQFFFAITITGVHCIERKVVVAKIMIHVESLNEDLKAVKRSFPVKSADRFGIGDRRNSKSSHTCSIIVSWNCV